MRSLTALSLVMALAACGALRAAEELAPLGPHPRLFADEAAFRRVKARLTTSDAAGKAFAAVLRKADATLAKPVLERKMEGRRLLSVSREALSRIGSLSLAWRMTGERKYAERGIAEAKAVSAFADWNPDHFLDVGEMTLAVAIARDWLDDALDASDRRLLAEAILLKGLTTGDGKTLPVGWWTTGHNNWNQVCNGGLAAGAAAVREDFPEVAEALLRRARKNLPLALKAYAGGNFPEGAGYWAYASEYTAVALDTLSRQFADGAPELFATEGLSLQASYMDLMTGPTGLLFNYSDPYTAPVAQRAPTAANCYFGLKFGRPGAFASEVECLTGSRTFGRFAALALVWSDDADATADEASPLCRTLGGSNPVAILRSGLCPDAWYVGVKGGSPSASHAHMDVGSFVLDAGGVRWAYDLGCEAYNRIEQMGSVDLWNGSQGSSRWSLFRLGVDGHGTLTIDGARQKVDGSATVSQVAPKPPSKAVVDMTPLYPGATKVVREFALTKEGLFVTDSLAGLKPGAVVTWNMNTAAKATARGRTLELRAADAKGVQKTMAVIAQVEGVEWKVSSIAEPRTPADSPNPGMARVSFAKAADEGGALEFTVAFALIPERAESRRGSGGKRTTARGDGK